MNVKFRFVLLHLWQRGLKSGGNWGRGIAGTVLDLLCLLSASNLAATN